MLWVSFHTDTDEDEYLNHWQVLMALKEVAPSEALTYSISKAADPFLDRCEKRWQIFLVFIPSSIICDIWLVKAPLK